MLEFFLSFKSFKSRKKVTESFFSGQASLSFHMMHKFPGTTFDYIGATFEEHFFDYNNILIPMKKDVEHISVNTVRAIFLLHKKEWFYIHNVRSNRPAFSVMQLFRTFLEIPVEGSL